MKRLIAGAIFFLIGLVFSFGVLKNLVFAAPPTNFQTTQIIGSGLTEPSGFEFAPDGRIFILERAGKVRVYKNGTLLAREFVTLQAENTGDRGLIGIAFDPNFASNHYVYFYYTSKGDLLNRIVRYDATGDTASGSGTVLFATTSKSFQLHVGGSLRFGPDGKLYFAVGDNGDTSNPQNLSNPHGKIHRINPDGSIPSDNPFFGQAGRYQSIWAYGFRNPWRFSFDSATGRMYLGDVGDNTWEEIDLVIKGGNYGWPLVEGPCPSPCSSIAPIYYYPHNGESRAVTMGPVYRGTMFPAEYRGKLFFGDYAGGFIKTLGLDSAGNSTGVADFDPNAGTVVDFKTASDGSLWYLNIFPGRLYKITYSLSNQVPVANATADVTSGNEPLTVRFSSAGSRDPDGGTLSYVWDFGDATSSTAANPTKVYNVKGTYTVQLTVSDGTNQSQAVPIVITVGVAPTVSIGAPTEGQKYNAGDTIEWHASAVDGRGQDIEPSKISTSVIFHHDTHIHPFLGPVAGNSGTFTVPTTGETSADTWFEIKVSATDDNNLTGTKSVNVFPNTSTFTLNTSPVGFPISLDGAPVTTPRTVTGVVNFQREIKAPLQASANGKNYQFHDWSDGGLIKHNITTQATSTTYMANYFEMPSFNAQYFANMTLSGTPTLTRADKQIDFDFGGGSPGAGIPVDKFSARWTKRQHFPAGNFQFTVTADDGVRLFVDNQLVIDKFIDQAPTTYTATVPLTAGDHDIKMEYYENGGGAIARLSWDVVEGAAPPPPPPPTGAYSASYYNNITLSGTANITRNEADINFDWGGGSPDVAITPDNFSARFTRTAAFEAGTHEFTVTADDGVRLYLDNQLIIDKWIDQAPTTYKVTRDVTAGNHDIKIEYYEKGGGAVMKFSFVRTTTTPPPPPPTGGYTGQYWNAGTGPAPVIPTTTPTLTRNDAEINFDFGGGSPNIAINPDHFVARWTGTKTFEAATYRFTTESDDGIRVYVDNQLIIDQWNDHGTTTFTADRAMTAGDHAIKVEYYENGGGAVAKFSFAKLTTTPPPPPPTSSFLTQFFNNMTLTGTPVLTRNDSVVNFLWTGSPAPGVNTDKFSARFTKDETFEAGTYEFTVSADDGVRLYIDNQLVIDKFIDQAETQYKVQRVMTAGTHNIRIEFYDNLWTAVIRFSMAKL